MSDATSTPDPSLARAFAEAGTRLDAHRRAWVIGVGRLVDEDRPADSSVALDAVLNRSFASGLFPSGPFPFSIDAAQTERTDRMQLARAHYGLPCGQLMESRLAVAEPGLVVEALTRSGCLGDGSCHPSHVMLSDVEAVLMDTLVLLESRAVESGFEGTCRIMIGVVSEVPGSPLELRVFDEGDGNLLRPAAGYDTFEPVFLEYHGRLGLHAGEQLLWDASLAISLRFGVLSPQMVTPPHADSRRIPA